MHGRTVDGVGPLLQNTEVVHDEGTCVVLWHDLTVNIHKLFMTKTLVSYCDNVSL